jgi:organic radical activating enzyme
MVSSNGEMCECEKQKLKEIAHAIYKDDDERAELLVDTVKEYHHKIITDNGLNFEHLLQQVNKEVKDVKRFCNKIDIGLLMQLHECIDKDDEEDALFQMRIIEFLQMLKEECRI